MLSIYDFILSCYEKYIFRKNRIQLRTSQKLNYENSSFGKVFDSLYIEFYKFIP